MTKQEEYIRAAEEARAYREEARAKGDSEMVNTWRIIEMGWKNKAIVEREKEEGTRDEEGRRMSE